MPNTTQDPHGPDYRNPVDKVISFFNADYAVRSLVSRQLVHQFGVGGYNPVPSRRGSSGGRFPNAGSETWASNRDRIRQMWDARDLCRYDFVGGIVARIILYVCGRIHVKSTTGVPQIDEAYDQYFHNWCGDETSDDGTVLCEITGRHRLIKMVQMALWAHLVDGDCGFVEVDPQFSPTGQFCLQMVEADRIGSPLEAQVQENYIGGITIDPDLGRIISYRVYQRTRTGMYIKPDEKLPSNFIHVFDPDWPDEYRGRTKLLRILNDARDIREWIEAEKITGKTQSQFAALAAVRDPFAQQGPTAFKQADPANPTQPLPYMDAQWGKILKMAEGETFSMIAPPARPSGSFMAFVEMIIRKMALSLDLPYGFIWDLARLGGVTARIETQGAQRKIEYWQDNILVNKILNRVREKVIAQGIMQKVLPPHPNWKSCEWHFGPWIVTDAGYELSNDLQGIQSSIIPISKVTAKYGMSPLEVFRANASTANEAIQAGTESGVPVEAFARGMFPDLTEQKAAYLQGPPPPPPPGSQEALGEKGVKDLIEVLTNVGEGKIDRDSAKQVLETTFHIDKATAEKLVPEEPEPIDKNSMNAMGNGHPAPTKRV